MIQTLFSLIDNTLGDRLSLVARQAHVAALVVLVLAWVMPWFTALWRKWRAMREDAYIKMWRCSHCGQYNPRQHVTCRTCAKPSRGLAWWERAVVSAVWDFLKRMVRSFASLYETLGWTLFYLLTASALWTFRLYSFSQKPLQEILASVALACLVVALYFFGKVFSLKWESPLTRVAQGGAATTFLAVFLIGAVAWSAAPFPPGAPLAQVTVSNQGAVSLVDAAGRKAEAAGVLEDGQVKWEVQYAAVSWPLVGLRQIFLTRVSDKPVLSRGGLLVLDSLAPRLQRESFYAPRVAILEQSINTPAGGQADLRAARHGAGLVVE